MAVSCGLVMAACSHTSSPSVKGPAESARPDPVQARIALAERRLAAGIALLKEGHLERARAELDAAVDTYLTSPGGAYADPRLAEAYRRTVEAIHLRELESLAAGDGFTEAATEPSSLDEVVGEIAVQETPASDETRRVAEEAVREEVNDFPVVLNDAVLACIDLYRGRLRDWFTAALARGGRYLPHIRATFAEHGIPQDLAYVALVESAFKTNALSRAKAKGVWQFIPATGRRFGLAQDWWVDERSHPEKATLAAARYLKELHGMFGDWNLALAGYNAGEHKVIRGINRYRTRDYWSLRRTAAFVRETRNYVPMIHAAIVVAKAPEKYGFSVESEIPVVSDTVAIREAVDLRTAAECAGVTLEDMRLLNPELRRLATPSRTYDLRVPTGRGETLLTCLAARPPDSRVRFRTHTVARGQTLQSIARRYGTNVTSIAEANGLASGQRVRRGQELIIPITAPARPTRAARRARTPAAVADTDTPAEGQVRISHTIRPGDTLTAIASRYGTTVEDLRQWNGIRGTAIAAGDTLTIYTRR